MTLTGKPLFHQHQQVGSGGVAAAAVRRGNIYSTRHTDSK